MDNKTTTWLLSITIFISAIIAPLLFISWRQEKKQAELYRQQFFYLWEKVEEIKDNKTTVNDILIYLNDLKKHEELMNELSGKIQENI